MRPGEGKLHVAWAMAFLAGILTVLAMAAADARGGWAGAFFASWALVAYIVGIALKERGLRELGGQS